MRFTFAILFLFAEIFVIALSPLYANENDSLSADYFLNQCLHFVSENKFDSAGICLDEARTAGLSKDSFFYYLSEMYIQKSALDTAIVFNYAIKATDNDSMHVKKFEQQYIIYSMLNLTNEANKASDSIKFHNSSLAKKDVFTLPKLSYGMTGDYEKTQSTQSDSNLLTSGFSYDLDCSIKWNLPWPKGDLFTIGADYSNNKSPEIQNLNSDSLAHTWGISFQINDIKSYSLAYKFERRKNRLSYYSSCNSLHLTWIKPITDKKGFTGYSLMANITQADSKVSDQIYGGYFFMEKPYSKKGSFGFSLNTYTVQMKNNLCFGNFRVLHVTDLDSTKQVFLKPSSLDTIKKPSGPKIESITKYHDSILANFTDTSFLISKITNSYFSLSPSISNTLLLFAGIKTKTEIEWTFTYYPDYYQVKNPFNSLLSYQYIGKSLADNQLISLSDINNPSDRYNWQKITLSKKRRIDNTLTLNISFEHAIWRLGTFTLNSVVEKNFSTLKGWTIIEIPDWSWNISSSFILNFPFANKSL